MLCFFVSDLHGHDHRYRVLFSRIQEEQPAAVFLGGDLLPPHGRGDANLHPPVHDFIAEYLLPSLQHLRETMGDAYPQMFYIPGNDDPRARLQRLFDEENAGLCLPIHARSLRWESYTVYGYAHVPPSPFQLKDWERYDVSRYVDPGCIAPEDGRHSMPVDTHALRYGTIADDLEGLTGERSLADAIFLFHTPPYQTVLDRAALDGKRIDHVPVDVHVGSIAVRRFIERRQPLLTLHGHVHESAALTGEWKQRIGSTCCIGAAHRGRELALVRFDPSSPDAATRSLL